MMNRLVLAMLGAAAIAASSAPAAAEMKTETPPAVQGAADVCADADRGLSFENAE